MCNFESILENQRFIFLPPLRMLLLFLPSSNDDVMLDLAGSGEDMIDEAGDTFS